MRRRVILALGVVSLLFSGCSIAVQRTAVPLPSSLHLAASTTTTLPSQIATKVLSVYFLKNGRLDAVSGYYGTDPLSVALSILSNGPTVPEAQRGITTAFNESPAKIQLAGSFAKGEPASIEIDTSFLNLPVIALEEASAQVVYTLTGLPNGPSSVRFVLDGQALESLVPPGKLVNRPVTRLDYCDFAPLDYAPCAKSAIAG